MNPQALLRNRLAAALAALTDDAGLADLVLPSGDPRFGDYQINCAMPLAKQLGQPPRDVAARIVAGLDVADLCHPPEIAGPGFINLRLRDNWLSEQLHEASRDEQRLGIEPVQSPRTFVIDYSAPNVAKPMHVGHIRSTVIGDALYRVLGFLGHRTISDNHIGDWGTQFGMIIYGYKHFADPQALQHDLVGKLGRLYQAVHQLTDFFETRDEKLPALRQQVAEAQSRASQIAAEPAPADSKQAKQHTKRLRQAQSQLESLQQEQAALEEKIAALQADPAFARRAADHPDIRRAVLAETAKLHAGDETNRALWAEFLPACLEVLSELYQRLGVTFDHQLGESFYHDRLPAVVADLTARGLATESEGAICLFQEGFPAPMIIQKQDGAFLYATTDLATIQYRMETWQPDAILYVVDHRQSLHFEQLFAAARSWEFGDVELEHISFGTVLGEDGRPFKTRTGAAIGLGGLLDEAVERAYRIVCQNDDERPEPLLDEASRRDVAEKIGIAAIKYADLAHNRTSDYVFSYDKMLAMTGNTAAYMQYAYARVRSIFGKAEADEAELRRSGARITLEMPQERALGVALLQFAEALDRVVADYRPNHLTAYLFDLASKYADFFENCHVLRAETPELRVSRLLLCDLTARTIRRGLDLLGIEVAERM